MGDTISDRMDDLNSGMKQVSANARQVGGQHYKGGYEHWDFVAHLGLNYWQGNATKYVTRAFKKNGKQDLEKALHYVDKCAELETAGLVDCNEYLEAMGGTLFKFCTINDLTMAQAQAIYGICRAEWEAARHSIRNMINSL